MGNIDLSDEHLYLTGETRKAGKAFDTGVAAQDVRLEYSDFAEGLAPQAPKNAALYEREVRAAPVRPVDDARIRKAERKNMREHTLDKWFGMKKQTLTPELEKELQKFFSVATEVPSGMRAAGMQASA